MLEIETLKPPAGAGEPSVIRPVAEFPPWTLTGNTEKPVSAGGFTVKLALRELGPSFPLILTTS